VIFALSLQPATVSNGTSEGVLARVLAVLGVDGLPPAQMDFLRHAIRKCAHFAEYALLGALWCGFFGGLSSAWLTATATAAADELLQRFVEGRSGQLSDVLLDSTGAVTGIVLMMCLRALFRKMHTK
jgi:VanZ family protein